MIHLAKGLLRMAGWLGLLAGLVSLGGCLVPQNDTTLTADPALGPPLNRAPRIAEELMPVSRFITASNSPTPGCGTLSVKFSAPVADPDLADTLHYRFYIDWDPVKNNRPFSANQLDGNAENTSEVRSPPIELDVPLSSASPLGAVGTHVVELWVSDGPSDNQDVRSAPVASGGDGGLVNHFYVATYAWVVNVTAACR